MMPEVLKRLGDVQTPLQNNAAIMAMNAEMMKTFGELNNLTRTTMLQTQRDLLNMLNEVDYRVASGMQSYSSAICEVLDRYAQSGVVIDYPTGARRSLEAAVRCCVVTSMNQTAAQVTNQYIAQKGIEYVLVSAHMGARHSKKFPDGIPSHDHWQGKVYKIVGSDKDTPNLLDATGYTVDPKTGQGRVVDPLGLHGYNCGIPISRGISLCEILMLMQMEILKLMCTRARNCMRNNSSRDQWSVLFGRPSANCWQNRQS